MHISEDNVLVPAVRMGVEAREMAKSTSGRWEDAPITRFDHPLVQHLEAHSSATCDSVVLHCCVARPLLRGSLSGSMSGMEGDNPVITSEWAFSKGPFSIVRACPKTARSAAD